MLIIYVLLIFVQGVSYLHQTAAFSETQILKPPKISPIAIARTADATPPAIFVNISGLPRHHNRVRFHNSNNYEWRLANENQGSDLKSNVFTKNEKLYAIRGKLRNLRNCGDIRSLQAPEAVFVASGWTKAVFRVRNSLNQVSTIDSKISSKDMALKMVDPKGTEMTRCIAQTGGDENGCLESLETKLLKEIVLIVALAHQNILKPIGYCIPMSKSHGIGHPITLLTELGEPVDLIKLVQMPWEVRLKIVYELTSLLLFLDSQSILISDFKIEQFVIVDGVLKLSDLDDLVFGDSSCASGQECSRAMSPDNENLKLDCKNKICSGLNTMMNRYRASTQFVNSLMAGPPASFKPRVVQLIDWYTDPSVDMTGLFYHMNDVLGAYKDGEYLESLPDFSGKFEKHEHQSIQGAQHDYVCPGSFSRKNCKLSAHHLGEAFTMCAERRHCDAIVWTQQRTWLGRRLIILKQLADSTRFSLTPVQNATVYIRQSRV